MNAFPTSTVRCSACRKTRLRYHGSCVVCMTRQHYGEELPRRRATLSLIDWPVVLIITFIVFIAAVNAMHV